MRKILSAVTLTVLLLVITGGILFRQDISDALRLRGYTPPVEVVALADNTAMLPGARRLFYVNHPEITDSETFNEHCRENEQTIVLGCYISGQYRIYLLDIKDERLRGIKEVTAAHELLHAAYDRLNGGERERINQLLDTAFNQITDSRIRETVALYRRQDPTIVPNELHSILGTEVRGLPEELEEYYRRYFSDRSKIISFSEQYEQAFTERRNAVRAYDAQLAALKTQIDSLSKQLTITNTELQAQRSEMNQHRANGRTDTYNELVPVYNAKVNQYNADVDHLGGLITEFNDIVQKRNAVAAEEAELVKAIDSRDIVPEQY